MYAIFSKSLPHIPAMVESNHVVRAGIGARVTRSGIAVDTDGGSAGLKTISGAPIRTMPDANRAKAGRVGVLSASNAMLVALLAFAATAHPAAAQCEQLTAGIKLLASDASANARLGYAVAISGNTIVAGDEVSVGFGQAYVYVLYGGFWTQQARLSDPSSASGTTASFGRAVALFGNTSIIGEPNSGLAFFTNRSGATWSTPAALVRADHSSFDQFGASVAMGSLGTHNTAIVGAPSYSVTASNAGAAYVFTISTQVAGGWIQTGLLTASDGAATDAFGTSVAISGNTAVVGAPSDDNTGGIDAGAVYVFTSNSFGSGWTQQAKIAPTDPHAGDLFGESVAISGDTIVVGAPNAQSNNGKAYVFTRMGTVWTQHAALAAGGTANHLGQSVAISGDRIVVGAPGSTPGPPSPGYAELYVRPPGSGIAGTWVYADYFVSPDGLINGFVGSAVAISDTRLAIGSYGADQGATDAGAVFVVDIFNPCPADFNCSGSLSINDIFDFLSAWFASDPRADFNGVNGLGIQDIFDFLAAWFAGCP